MSELWADMPAFLSGHLRMTLIALAVGVTLSLPTGILATRVPWLERIVLAVASVVQTIPGLALLAVMVPVLAALSLPSIGMLPALIGLSAYSVLPILRNTVTGIRGVDAKLIEAARGVGMSQSQRLRLVELPLAMPVIVAGLRTASVWVVGTATLSTPVGATSLGNYIFSGLQTRNDAAVLMGCAAAAVLALCLDGLIRLLEYSLDEGRKWLRNACLMVFAAAYLWVGLGPLVGLVSTGGRDDRIQVGTKTFTEQYLLGELLDEQITRRTELEVEVVPSLGSKVAFDALVSGDIDVYVDYSGTLWTNVMHREPISDRDKVLAEAERWLVEEHDVVLVGPLGFENAYVLSVPRERAEELGLQTIADLRPHASDWAMGGDYEFFGRPEWPRIRDTYGLEFAETRSMDNALMYEAVRSGQVDVIGAFSTDGRIKAYDLDLLRDPKRAIPPYDAVILVNGETARAHPELVDALEQLVGTIDAKLIRKANAAVDLDKRPIEEVAQEVLVPQVIE